MPQEYITDSTPILSNTLAQSMPTDTDAKRTQKQTYDVSLPEGWDKYIAVGRFTVASRPFYSLAAVPNNPVFNKPWPVVLCYWSLKNLTNGPLYVEVNYGSRLLDGMGGTGLGVGYLLRSSEPREICTLVPITSATEPVSLRVRLEELRLPEQILQGDGHYGLIAENLDVSPSVPGDFIVVNEDKRCLQVTEPGLALSDEGDYFIEFGISNPWKSDARLAVQTSVSDLTRGVASSVETEVVVKGGETALVKAPYAFSSDPGEKPLLAYRVSETPDMDADDMAAVGLTEKKLDYISHGGNVLSAGSVDLSGAAQKGLVTLPDYKSVPVEERAKLTEQKQSEHFLFRYRPGSYAAENIEQAINDREEAYRKLKDLLQMDLPSIITVDLYPDIEAKGLGSGTTWTSANTVTNTHVAEVYNESYQCDSNHELAHIFTYHFGGGGGVLCEPFAASCEAQYDIPEMMEAARQKLSQSRLSSLESILLASSWGADTMAFIHYLIQRDLARFKQFYVRMGQVKERYDLDKVLLEVYGTDLLSMEQQWRDCLRHDGY